MVPDAKQKNLKVAGAPTNAWRYNAQPGQTEWMPGRPPDIGRKFLERAIWKSATGRNLKEMLPLAEMGEENVMLGEASPYIGNVASSKFPMDPDFVCQQIREYKPDVVLLLGAEARKARPFVEAAGVEVVEGDHPVARLC